MERRKDIPQLIVLDLSRNFGHHHAIQAGLQHARGSLIFLIDCDLEVSPFVLIEFYRKLCESDCDVVFGYQEVRKGGRFEQISGGLFWKGFNFLGDIKIPENIVTERIMTRRYIDALLQMGDRNLFLGGMMSWAGFRQIGLPVVKKQRDGGSTYTLTRRIGLMVNAVSSFSAQPLIWLFNIGIIITLLSFSFAFYLVRCYLLYMVNWCSSGRWAKHRVCPMTDSKRYYSFFASFSIHGLYPAYFPLSLPPLRGWRQ